MPSREIPQNMLVDYLTVGEASQYLGVSPSTLRNWDRLGKLKAFRHPINGYRLYSREQLDAIVRSLGAHEGIDTNSNLDSARKQLEELDRQLALHYENKLVVNPEINRKMVSFQANKQENSYRWFKYKEGFSSVLMRYIFKKTGIKSGLILDPFAGAGTALFTAADLGIDADGIDLLPICAEIMEVRKLVLENPDKQSLAHTIKTFVNSRSWETEGKTFPFPHLTITQGAFSKETEYQLGRYLYEAERVADLSVRKILRFAALCILEDISFTRKDGQYLRWDTRSGRRAGKKPFNKGYIPRFTEAITRKLEEIVTDLIGQESLFNDMNVFPSRRGRIRIYRGSCLEILPKLKASTYDALVTSPPYCNRYDYTRTYALELAMLGIDDSAIKALRQTMLTCTVENREKSNLDMLLGNELIRKGLAAFEEQNLLNRIVAYLEQCKENHLLNNTGIPRMVRNYFLEMSLVIAAAARVLKRNAPFVMVNDNVRYQGIHIPVDLILSDIAEKLDFSTEVIWVLPKGKGNSSQQMGLHGRQELRKCVYVWRRL